MDCLDRGLIGHHERWRLAMRADSDALHALFYSPAEPDGLIYRAIPLDPAASTPLRALEDAVYANELLLSDFVRTDLIVSPESMLVIPADSTPDQAALLLGASMSGDPLQPGLPTAFGKPFVTPTAAANAAVVTALETDLEAFVRRTFYGIRITPAVAVLTDYFIGVQPSGNTRRMYAVMRRRDMDLLVLDRSRLIHAARIDCASPADAAYYIMAVRQLLHLGSESDPVIVSGESPLREGCVALLRRWVLQVLPAIFPSDLMGVDGAATAAPPELTAIMLTTTSTES